MDYIFRGLFGARSRIPSSKQSLYSNQEQLLNQQQMHYANYQSPLSGLCNNPQYAKAYTREEIHQILRGMSVTTKPNKRDIRRAKLLLVTKKNGYSESECSTATRILAKGDKS